MAAGIKKNLVTTGQLLNNNKSPIPASASSSSAAAAATSHQDAATSAGQPSKQVIGDMTMTDLYTMSNQIITRTARDTGDILVVASQRLFAAKKYDPTASVQTMAVTREAHRTHAVLASALKSTERELRVIDTGTKMVALEESKGINVKNARHHGLDLFAKNDRPAGSSSSAKISPFPAASGSGNNTANSTSRPTTAAAATAVIPFSAHSLHTLRRKSLFASTEQQRAEKLQDMEDNDRYVCVHQSVSFQRLTVSNTGGGYVASLVSVECS
jgi:hypothetical protein